MSIQRAVGGAIADRQQLALRVQQEAELHGRARARSAVLARVSRCSTMNPAGSRASRSLRQLSMVRRVASTQ